MQVIERLIKKLLTDDKIDYFNRRDPKFQQFQKRVMNRPEAAEILVRFMQTESPEIATRAREMLYFFDVSAVRPVALALAKKGALWRAELLNILWSIMSAKQSQDTKSILQGILPQLLPLLDDNDIILGEEKAIEVEYEYRVCDDVYTLIQEWLDPKHDPSVFFGISFEERDEAIKRLKQHFQPTLLA